VSGSGVLAIRQGDPDADEEVGNLWSPLDSNKPDTSDADEEVGNL
jgi:hypothetical protein